MKLKKAGILTRIVILALVAYALVTLVTLRTQLAAEKAQSSVIEQQINQLEQANEEMRYEIDHSSDPETIAAIARDKLGLVKDNEIVFYDVSD